MIVHQKIINLHFILVLIIRSFPFFRLKKGLGVKPIFFFIIFSLFALSCFAQQPAKQLRVSKKNAHLLVTENEKPVFLNNCTVWVLARNGSREDVDELISKLTAKKFNAISILVLDFNTTDIGINYYGDFAFELNKNSIPNPLKPIVTPGNNPGSPSEYDFWDHLDYIIKKADENGMYVFLHPAWGEWFSGSYTGNPNKYIIFNEKNAYSYGHWLGERYRDSKNVIWMLGGDRSAVHDPVSRDYRGVYNAMAKGITNGVNSSQQAPGGNTDNKEVLISYHPRKWAPNSSEWFHNEKWLSFNSIQDTPYDQIVSVPKDYELKPIKPTWLYEGRYEGAITDWGIRYQAWQTVLSGGFGHNYGSDIVDFPKDNWRGYLDFPGLFQMEYLYDAARGIWTDKQFMNREPDQSLIIGDQGTTVGDGNTRGDGDGGGAAASTKDGRSDRITAMRANDGSWAIVYSAAGENIHLNLAKLKGKLNAFWFNPATGRWWVDENESAAMIPFLEGIKAGKGNLVFDAPGRPGKENDWVLILKK